MPDAGRKTIQHIFRYVCASGHFDVAKWLYELYPNIDIHEYGDFAMVFASHNGHTEVVKWLNEIQR